MCYGCYTQCNKQVIRNFFSSFSYFLCDNVHSFVRSGLVTPAEIRNCDLPPSLKNPRYAPEFCLVQVSCDVEGGRILIPVIFQNQHQAIKTHLHFEQNLQCYSLVRGFPMHSDLTNKAIKPGFRISHRGLNWQSGWII